MAITNNLNEIMNSVNNAVASGLTFQSITKDAYNAMGTHDPSTCYVIDYGTGSYDMYIGDVPMEPANSDKDKSHYTMSITPEGKYMISYVKYFEKFDVDVRYLSLFK